MASTISEDMEFFKVTSVPVYFINDKSRRPLETLFPKPGFVCKVKWEANSKFSKDWPVDGYTWRQDSGGKPVNYNNQKVIKYYFKLRIANGEDPECFTREFYKKGYMYPNIPNEVLIIYGGDKNVINKGYFHGNAKKPEKVEKPYFRTVPSVIASAKERKEDAPSKIHLENVNSVNQNMKSQAVEASRDVEQIRNAQKVARRAERISHDSQYNVYVVGQTVDFLDGFQIVPNINIVGVHKGKSLAPFFKIHAQILITSNLKKTY